MINILNNLSLAWSRDTDTKVYVQTQIKSQGEELFKWLEEGAYLYICGDNRNRISAIADI